MPRLGVDTAGADGWIGLSSSQKHVTKHTHTGESTTLTAFVVYICGYTNTCPIKGVVYSDDSGAPDALLGVTEEVSILATRPAGWLKMDFGTPVAVTQGADYHIGLHIGGTAGAIKATYEDGAGDWHHQTDTYANGTSDPFGAASTGTNLFGWYAEYDVPQIRLLPEAQPGVSCLDIANKVYVLVKGSSPLVSGTATNTTVAPTYANSPREMVELVEGGDASACAAIAAAHLALRQTKRYNLSRHPVRLRDGLGIQRGMKVPVVIPRAGINGDYPVQRVEHDFAANVTWLDLGEFVAARDDSAMLTKAVKLLAQLEKEAAI